MTGYNMSKAKDTLTSLRIAGPALRMISYCRDRAFDWRHGVDTCGTIDTTALTVRGDRFQARPYQPVYAKGMAEILRQLTIEFAKYTFLDFGSGKGRAMLMASEYPFKRIIGVECTKELHEIAERNFRSYRSRARKCLAMESVHSDAAEYEIPAEPMVVYFYNPFREAVMTRVLANIQRSLDAYPREMIIISFGRWTQNDLIERLRAIEEVAATESYKIYRISPAKCCPPAEKTGRTGS